MNGSENDPGIIHRAVKDIFTKIKMVLYSLYSGLLIVTIMQVTFLLLFTGNAHVNSFRIHTSYFALMFPDK